MHITIRATQQQKAEFENKNFNSSVTVCWLAGNEELQHITDAFFDLTFNDADIDANKFATGIIVFTNAVDALNVLTSAFWQINFPASIDPLLHDIDAASA